MNTLIMYYTPNASVFRKIELGSKTLLQKTHFSVFNQRTIFKEKFFYPKLSCEMSSLSGFQSELF